MREHKVVSIYITPKRRSTMEKVHEIIAIEGRGIQGDRFYKDQDPKDGKGPKGQITFIESEALEALKRDYGVTLDPSETRRNVLTAGVPLNHLMNRTFQIGEAVFEGAQLCEPCEHLEAMTRPGVLQGLIHRGGLRARVLKGGTIREGDTILF